MVILFHIYVLYKIFSYVSNFVVVTENPVIISIYLSIFLSILRYYMFDIILVNSYDNLNVD